MQSYVTGINPMKEVNSHLLDAPIKKAFNACIKGFLQLFF